MSKKPNNIKLFKQTAKKLGLQFKAFPVENNPKLYRISGNGRFYLGSAKAPGFYPNANRWGAHLTGNKKLAQTILSELGYKTIKSVVLEPEKYKSAKAFLEASEKKCRTYPLILKPNKGLDGRGIKYLTSNASLKKALKELYTQKITAIVQPIVTDSEYRILIVNHKVELVHSKDFRSVTGDGVQTIGTLLQKVAKGDKNDDFIAMQLQMQKYTAKTVLAEGEVFPCHIVKNSSARHYQTNAFPKDLLRWAKKLSQDLAIPTLGVDLFVNKDLGDSSKYTIIELNSNPGLSHYYDVCNDSVQPERICEKVLKAYFKI